MAYSQPNTLYEWRNDEPDQELYLVSILGNKTVLSAYGRFSHSSGGKAVEWSRFLQGEMNELVEKTMGSEVLQEVLTKLRELT